MKFKLHFTTLALLFIFMMALAPLGVMAEETATEATVATEPAAAVAAPESVAVESETVVAEPSYNFV